MKKTPAKKKIISKPAKRVKKTIKPVASVQTEKMPEFGLHNLVVPHGAHKKRKLLGRGPGSGHGKTSTRGSKGQTSRSGRDFYAGFEGGQSPLIRRMPKRGFTSIFKKEFQIVNLDRLGKLKDALITPEILLDKGLIKDKSKLIKILGDGEIKNPVTIQAHAFSKSAQEKIQKAGGKVEIINVTK